jgi:RNA polymerase primary sigma factor
VQELLDVTPLTSTLSLSHPVGDDDTEIGELLADIEAESPYEAVEESLIREDVREVIESALDPREAHVIALRFGFGDSRPRSLQEIGDELGLSRERVRQIEREALRKLRREARLSA